MSDRFRMFCSCGQSLVARVEHVGKKAKCPACGVAMLIALPASASASPQALLDARPKSAPPKPQRTSANSPSQSPPSKPAPSKPAPSKPGLSNQAAQPTARGAATNGAQASRPQAPRSTNSPRPANTPATQPPAAARQRPTPQPPAASIWDEEDSYSMAAEATSPCPGCDAPCQPGSVLCVQCGYNLQTGRTVKGVKPKAPSPLNVFARYKISKWWLLAPVGMLLLIGLIFPTFLAVFDILFLVGSFFALFGTFVWYFALHLRYHPGKAIFLMFQIFFVFFGYALYRRGGGGRSGPDPRYDGPRRLLRWSLFGILGSLVGMILVAGVFSLHGQSFPPRRSMHRPHMRRPAPTMPPASGWEQHRIQ